MVNSDNRPCYSLFPKPLAACIEPLTRPVLKTQGLAGSRIVEEWEAIVGPHLASRTVPEKLSFPKGKKSGGTLTIAVENGFALELQYQQPVILERLAAYFGYQAVARIAISHSYLPSEPAMAQPAKTPRRAMAFTEGTGDAELDAALAGLAESLSRP